MILKYKETNFFAEQLCIFYTTVVQGEKKAKRRSAFRKPYRHSPKTLQKRLPLQLIFLIKKVEIFAETKICYKFALALSS
ncbi:hypothetical protein [Flavobacterium caeni]|uniref:hypothetical protein n=1 Tax=Flavobacterium caeni TaxID=490189 RepID=UPI000B852E1A|nr:hypothetical protein [Flavobacterium caeni]